MLILASPWTRQPGEPVRIAAAWRDKVVACIIPSLHIDLVNGPLIPDGTTPNTVAGSHGMQFASNAAGLWYSRFPVTKITTVAGTAILTAGTRDLTDGATFHAGAGETASGGGFFGIESNTDSSANVQYRARGRAGGSIARFDCSNTAVRGRASCVTVYRLTSASTATCSIDGIDAGGRLTDGSMTDNPLWSTFAVGGVMRDSGTYGAAGTGYAIAALLRNLTQIEERDLSLNPWQLFAPRRIWVPVTAAPTGPTVVALTPTTIGSTSHRPRYTWTP